MIPKQEMYDYFVQGASYRMDVQRHSHVEVPVAVERNYQRNPVPCTMYLAPEAPSVRDNFEVSLEL